MPAAPACKLLSLTAIALATACRPDADQITYRPQAMSFANSEWSAPVNLGPVVNSSSNEQNATLARDGLSLYFSSNRPGGSGPLDIWVAHRADPNDDFAWEDPVPMGPGVNTAAAEQAPMYLQNAEDGSANLYFNRGALAQNLADIYVASVTRDGETLGPAQLVVELSDPTANDAAVTIRADGRELMFWSPRGGGLGGNDLWVSTRQTIHDSWSPPVSAGTTLNSSFDDVTPSVSWDGRTLIFASNRPGGSGGNDIYMSTRTPSGKE